MERYLITLSSPIAIKTADKQVRLVSIVEATIGDGLRAGVEGTMEVRAFFDTDKKAMIEITPLVVVTVKASNIRSKQSAGYQR